MAIANQPSIALLIPCFNGLQHLPHLIEQVQRLERGFDEMIVYDDASTEPFPFNPAEQFPQIKFYRGEVNGGAGYARNRLIELATADYLHFHDIDDTEIPANFLTELAPYLSPKTIVFSSWQIQALDAPPKLYDYPNFVEVEDFRQYFLSHHIHMNAAIFPRDLALKVKFDQDFRAFEDLLFNLRFAEAGAIYRHVETVIANYQKNSRSTLGRMKPQQFQEYEIRYCQRCQEILPERYHSQISRIALDHAWNACLQRFDNECELAISIAQNCGKLDFSQFGTAIKLVAPWLGVSQTLKLRRWWFENYASKRYC